MNRVDLTDTIPIKMRVQVLEVFDGDTVAFKPYGGGPTERLRISKIDAPELGQPTIIRTHNAGWFSKNCLEKKLQNSKILVSLEGRDMYGRWLGDLIVNEKNISFYLVQEGCAGIYAFATFKSSFERDLYLRWYEEAKENLKGLWKWGGFMRPYHFRRAQKK